MSGCEGEKTCNDLKLGLKTKYPGLSENYVVWSDTVAPVIVAHEEGMNLNPLKCERFFSLSHESDKANELIRLRWLDFRWIQQNALSK